MVRGDGVWCLPIGWGFGSKFRRVRAVLFWMGMRYYSYWELIVVWYDGYGGGVVYGKFMDD